MAIDKTSEGLQWRCSGSTDFAEEPSLASEAEKFGMLAQELVEPGAMDTLDLRRFTFGTTN
jgi:hypothetical protein